ncbi:DUF2560 family protein [Serratia liquefaciens]|uniref:DUF2560 family protein n=1 Tax=Serratia liquefaciens TaxID=614 RepID=UPI0021832728|nr:DUF2560 family protein [Serratia liquefaciens]CAI2420820.1 Protein of uncharacterised function (DUF2560) [Serratia liquefaciens]
MSIDSKLTDEQNSTLVLLDKLSWDTEAAKVAVDFIQGEELRLRLFTIYFDKAGTVNDAKERTEKAIAQAKEALALFPDEGL